MPALAAVDPIAVAIFCGVFATFVALLVATAGNDKTAAKRKARLERVAIRSTSYGDSDLAATIQRRDRLNRQQRMEGLFGRGMARQAALTGRLRRSGSRLGIGGYILLNLVLGGIAFGGAVLIAGLGLPVAAIIGVGLGLLLPHLWLGMMINRRTNKFLTQFPEAIDQIVRGVRSGLPVGEAMKSIATELADPVAGEFQAVVDQVRLGQNMDEALWSVAARLQIPEFNFLVISMGVQRETGGNLAETLENLSDIIRRRHQMQQKVRAMASEARASAWIVGALPVLLFGAMMLLNPDYASALFTDPRGKMLLGAAICTEALGIFVMSRMAKFQI
ncbi:tight adherence protein B [Constrictibacter sp. MBR-5]|jgi:tight adherence protein B|uniref:type II secretion system F family protein n=1 Tax=Constrictibacter sp. MBR-5 TaxID=3156467 RepID=UPI00339A608C